MTVIDAEPTTNMRSMGELAQSRFLQLYEDFLGAEMVSVGMANAR